MCILFYLFVFGLNVASIRYQLSPTLFHLGPLLLYCFSFWIFSPLMSEGFTVSTISVLLSFSPFMSISIYIYKCSYIGCVYFNECNGLFLYWSLYHYIMPFFVFYYRLCFKEEKYLKTTIWVLRVLTNTGLVTDSSLSAK